MRSDTVLTASSANSHCRLFHAEARVTIAKLLWNFDIELFDKRTDWLKDQAAYIVYEPKSLLVKLLDRQRRSKV